MLSSDSYLTKILLHIQRYVLLTSKEKDLLTELLKVKRVKKRQYVLQEGDVCKNESYVVVGCLRTFYTDKKGVEHTLSFAVEDWWATDLDSFIRTIPSHYNIEALETSLLLQIDKESLDYLYKEAPVFERYFRLLHQNAYIAQSKRILSNISMTGEERYTTFLETYRPWTQRIPQKYIASYLGLTPVYLSEIRKQLRIP